MKNVFYLNVKALFVLKIFEYFSGKDKVNFKIDDAIAWLTKNYNTHIVQYLTK